MPVSVAQGLRIGDMHMPPIEGQNCLKVTPIERNWFQHNGYTKTDL